MRILYLVIFMFFNFLNVNANYNELAYSFKFNGINGKQISLDDYKEKLLLLLMWQVAVVTPHNIASYKIYGLLTKMKML